MRAVTIKDKSFVKQNSNFRQQKLTFKVTKMISCDTAFTFSLNVKALPLPNVVPELFKAIGKFEVNDGIIGVDFEYAVEITGQCDSSLCEFRHETVIWKKGSGSFRNKSLMTSLMSVTT